MTGLQWDVPSGVLLSEIEMSVHRDLMMKALKTSLLPALRERGFKGSFPHFRRAGPDRIDFVMIQFRREGGSFTIEIGHTGPEGISEGPWADVPVEKLTVGHFHTVARYRVSTGGGDWFEFGPSSYDGPKPAKPVEFYDGIAEEAVQRFDKDAEPWFAKPRTL